MGCGCGERKAAARANLAERRAAAGKRQAARREGKLPTSSPPRRWTPPQGK